MTVLHKIKNRLKSWHETPFVRTYGIQYRAMQGFRQVDGFLSDREAIFLYDMAKAINTPSPVVVEIGSWVGRSSVAISHGLANKSNAKLYCIDPFNAAGDAFSASTYNQYQQQLPDTLLETFQRNIATYGYPEVVVPTQGYSYDVARNWEKPIDFLFIDAAHDYEDVLRDFTDWQPHLKVGSVIAFHDIRLDGYTLDVSGPCRVVRDHIFTNDQWEAVTQNLVESIFAARKKC